jgi:hypothetical protein
MQIKNWMALISFPTLAAIFYLKYQRETRRENDAEDLISIMAVGLAIGLAVWILGIMRNKGNQARVEKSTNMPKVTKRGTSRAIVFRVLAGLLAVAFGALLAFGDTFKMSLREVVGIGIIAVAFALYSILGTEVGERFLSYTMGFRNPDSSEKPPENNKKT